jgi:nickel superoxide dismutase
MPRLNIDSLISGALRTADRLSPPAVAAAHCDIPCGIYDPHYAQIAALSVVRMHQLIDALELAGDLKNKGDQAKYHNSVSRYIAVKEEHAEIVKREVRIIWGDYFKPEHTEKYPDLHATVWNIMKLAGKGKQEVNMKNAEDLLAAVQKFAEMFWDSKGMKTARVPSGQAMGGELVVPN